MNIVKRFWTALVLLTALFLVLEYGNKWVLFAALQAVVIASLIEFYNLARRRRLYPAAVLGILFALLLGASFLIEGLTLELALFAGLLGLGVFYVVVSRTIETAVRTTASIAVTVFGPLYIGFTLNFLYPLRQTYGSAPIYFLLAVVFLADTGAFFVGKAAGRHPMTPIASPNKTWEGAAGGLIFAGLTAWAARAVFLPEIGPGRAILTGLAVSIAAQAGDPLESLFKRAAGVKDSSNALPGHGGFLDRVDSLLFAVPLFYFIVRYIWKPLG